MSRFVDFSFIVLEMRFVFRVLFIVIFSGYWVLGLEVLEM